MKTSHFSLVMILGTAFGAAAMADTIDASGTKTSALASGGDRFYRVWKSDGGVDFVHVFTNTSAAATFTNTSGKDLSVRYLAVGGGGAGGTTLKGNYTGGGGGGGGGVKEVSDLSLAADVVWTIRVGAGGVAAAEYSASDTDGGATAISNGTMEVACVPAGGHGSHSKGDGANAPLAAQPGAAGGGGGYYVYAAGIGRYGTNGTYKSSINGVEYGPFSGGNMAMFYTNEVSSASTKWLYLLSGGGGGAGGAGETRPTHKDSSQSDTAGAGGAGLASDITGATVCYGAGGGGGGLYHDKYLMYTPNHFLAGGAGGSANVGGAGGTVMVDGETPIYVAAQAGLAETGTGGGGGLGQTTQVNKNALIGGNGGSGVVIIRYTAVSSWNEAANTPDFEVLGVEKSSVTLKMSGETETDGDGKLWIKPDTTATLYATTSADGFVLAGWEDSETGEFIRGDLVQVTPETRRSYTAVFGKPWTYDTTTKKLTNGDWIFDVSGKGLVTNCTQAAADTVLNLATPMTDENGAAFNLSALGSGSSDKTSSLIPKTICETVRIFLPEGVDLKQYCFRPSYQNAAVRGSLSLPRGITVGAGVFNGDSCLTSVYFEGGRDGGQIMSTSYGMFRDCSALAKIGPSPRTYVEVDNANFYGCTSLTTLELLDVCKVGYQSFYNCTRLEQIVFGTNTLVGAGDDCWTGNSCIFYGVPDTCRYVFPGKAPSALQDAMGLLHATGTATVDNVAYPYVGTVGKYFFGKTSGVKLYGSWRLDPEGWEKIRSDVGADMSHLPSWVGTPPTIDRAKGERRVKGVFYWAGQSDAQTPCYGWLIDAAMPGEPEDKSGMMLLFK